MRRNDVALMSVQRHFDVMCLLGIHLSLPISLSFVNYCWVRSFDVISIGDATLSNSFCCNDILEEIFPLTKKEVLFL